MRLIAINHLTALVLNVLCIFIGNNFYYECMPLVDDSFHYSALLSLTLLVSSLNLRRLAHVPLAKRLMHMVHLSGNTSVVSKSSSDWLNYTGFPGDVCVVFFNVPPGNKDAVAPNSLVKEKSCCVYKCDANDYQGRLKAVFQNM